MRERDYAMRELSAEMLVKLARDGDNLAFCELVNRYAGMARYSAQKIVRNREDAEDAVQEAFLRAFTKIDTFAGTSAFSTWLIRIVINTSLLQLRQKRAKPTTSFDDPASEGRLAAATAADTLPGPEERYQSKEIQQLVRVKIVRLPATLREAALSHLDNDFSISSFAFDQGISRAAAKSRLFRAKKALSRSLSFDSSKRRLTKSSRNDS